MLANPLDFHDFGDPELVAEAFDEAEEEGDDDPESELDDAAEELEEADGEGDDGAADGEEGAADDFEDYADSIKSSIRVRVYITLKYLNPYLCNFYQLCSH